MSLLLVVVRNPQEGLSHPEKITTLQGRPHAVLSVLCGQLKPQRGPGPTGLSIDSGFRR